MISKIFIFLFFAIKIVSQPFLFSPNKIGFTENNLPNGFSGGIDNPRFQFCDIDGDGDFDLFIMDRDLHLQYYESINGNLIYKTYSNFNLFPGTWFRFCDIDGDNKLDFISNSILAQVLYHKNISANGNIIFEKNPIIFRDTLNNTLISEPYSIPTFADIDDDGDFDFFTGSSLGQISFYKNIGDKNNPKFKFETDKFQNLFIRGDGRNLINKKMHGVSALEFFDADSNGTLDLFWGDYYNKSLYYLKNIGSSKNPNIVLSDSSFPKPDTIATMGFNQIQHLDFDNDKRIDFFIGTLFPIQNKNTFMFYKNVESNKNPKYELATKEFIPMIDIGARCAPHEIDIENDGDYDFLLGSEDGKITLLKNVGTKTVPNFVIDETVFLNENNNYFSFPTTSDIDNDGKKEMLVGNYFGTLNLFEINSTTQIEFIKKSFQLDTIDFGQESAPHFADLNNDNLIDLIVGAGNGKLYYFQNIGTKSNPFFKKENFSLDTLKLQVSVSTTSFDWNGDGKQDLLISTGDGKLLYFQNISNGNYLEFNYLKSVFDSISVYKNYFANSNSINKILDDRYIMNLPIVTRLVDIDNDKDLDIFIGSLKGGIYYFENKKISTSILQNEKNEIKNISIRNFPNPFNLETTINFSLINNSNVSIVVYNLIGEEILKNQIGYFFKGENNHKLECSKFKTGVYFYRLEFLNGNDLTFSEVKTFHLIK